MSTKFLFQSNKKQSIHAICNKNSYGSFSIEDGITTLDINLQEFQNENTLSFYCLDNQESYVKLVNAKMWGLDFSELGKKEDLGCQLLCRTQCFDNSNKLLPEQLGNQLVNDNGTISIKYSWPIDVWFFEQLQWIRNSETLKF